MSSLAPRFRVMKFGGSSVGTAHRLARVLEIIERERQTGPIAVVVSAMGDTTDWLIDAAKHAAAGDYPAAERELTRVGEVAVATIRHVLALRPSPDASEPDVESLVSGFIGELRQLLFGISLLRERTAQSQDLVLSFGERLSATLVSAVLSYRGLPSVYVDARRWVVTDAKFGTATVDWEETRRKVRELRREWDGVVPIHTGFIGLTPDGRTTTLGRNGSDYTATLLGRGLDATEVTVWTDVSGVMTADPGIVAEAYPLNRLSYMEAVELANYGARLFHPRTMIPLIESGIPMRIRSTTDEASSGTVIDAVGALDRARPTSVASLERLAIVDIEWRRLAVPAQIGRRVLHALETAGVTVWMASQAAHGQAVAVVVPLAELDTAKAAIQSELSEELEKHEVEPVGVRSPVTLLTLVCETMGKSPNVSGRFFGALGSIGVDVHAIAQGASERSISCVISAADTPIAVRTVHAAFNFAHEVVSLVVLGKGTVGSQLLQQIEAQREVLRRDHGVLVRVVGICGATQAVFDDRGDGIVDWQTAWKGARPHAELGGVAGLLDRLRRLSVPILVDCTSADAMERLYLEAFQRGIHVVGANKKPLAGTTMTALQDLMAGARRHHRAYRYETTVGASLPVIETLKNLIRTGDRVQLIEGSFSGTLGYLTNEVMAGVPLSQAVQVARDLGYTEPQPQDDLSGLDVARKALILARELGLRLEIDDVLVEPLVPAELLAETDVPRFLARLEAIDTDFSARIASYRQRGETLRYLARIDPEAAASGRPVMTVGPVAIPADHPAVRLRGSEAFVAFTTERYRAYPLIVQGAGAGGAVTAAGVLADVLAIAQSLRGQ